MKGMKGGVVHMRTILEIPAFDIGLEHPLHRTFTFTDKSLIDYTWLQEQMDYMEQLSEREKHISYTYTIYGDELMNRFKRNQLRKQEDITHILDRAKASGINLLKYQHYDETKSEEMDEIYYQNAFIYIPRYIEEFSKIIRNSPPLKRPIRVFRGIKDGEYIKKHLVRYGNKNAYFHNIDFLSSSIFVPPAAGFTGDSCCMLEITIHPSVRCMFTAYLSKRRYEYEITIEPDTYLDIHKIQYKLVLDSYEQHEDMDVFIHPAKHEVRKIVTVSSTLTKIQP